MAVYACRKCKATLNKDAGALLMNFSQGGPNSGVFVVVVCHKCGTENRFQATEDDFKKRRDN